MKRYADPARCPDCGQPITYGAPSCTSCDLPLLGPVASELFTTLSRADQLLESLRRTATAPAAAPAQPVAVPPFPSATTPRPSRLRGASVPVILLTLGAGCLLVAALVFLAVAWVVLGVEGRTAVLVAFTAASAGLTWVQSGRALRGATEALGLVTLGLTALDLAGARSAGWFGSPDTATFLVLFGLVMAAVSVGACLALRGRAAGEFVSGEVVFGLATGVAAIGIAGLGWESEAFAALAAVTVAGVLSASAGALRLTVAAFAAGAVTALSWLALVMVGLVDLLDEPTLAHAWGDFAVWPVLVAAGLVAAAVAVRLLPQVVRVGAGAVALALLVSALVAPAADEDSTVIVVIALALLAVCAGSLLVLPRPWAAVVGLTAAVAAVPAVVSALALGGLGASHLLETASRSGGAGDSLRTYQGDLDLAPWLLVPAVAVLAFAIWAVASYAGQRLRVAPENLAVLVATTVLLSAATYPAPILLLVALPALVGLALVVRGRLVSGAAFLLVALAVGQYADALALGAATLALAAAAWVLVNESGARERIVAGAAGQLVLAGWVWTAGQLLESPGNWVAAAAILVLAVAMLAVRGEGPEVGAALGILVLASLGLENAVDESVWAAVYLTLGGVAASALALLRTERRPVAWLGGFLLAAATWVRLADLGVQQPEAYTLPSAIALLAVGLLHLHRDPETDTLRALSPGLALALVPSLLWVLVEPATVRALALGLACLALVLVAIAMRWTAPLVHAGTVGAIVVLRHAAPFIDAGVPRWVLIGLAGGILVALGITWESRVREARQVLGYVQSLR